MTTVLVTSTYEINSCHTSKIQNLMLNISHILFWGNILEHCFGHSVNCISNLVLVLNNKIVCSTIICFIREEHELKDKNQNSNYIKS